MVSPDTTWTCQERGGRIPYRFVHIHFQGRIVSNDRNRPDFVVTRRLKVGLPPSIAYCVPSRTDKAYSDSYS